MRQSPFVHAKYLGRPASRSICSAVALLALLAGHHEARACGGLFCNSRPPDPFAPLPVAQNGENVVFSITKDPAGGAPTLVAHIQIMYTGDAAKFSWVVPVDAAPDLGVGTDSLFSSLARVTQPQFQPTYITDGSCLPPPQGFGSGGSVGAFPAGTGGASASGGPGGAMGSGVTVSFQGAVGPFDAAVIKSDDPVALKMWLSDNGYVVSDAAAALIDVYVREGKFFVALKLLNGVGVRSIQPIVLTFRGTEPCVPLRLTAIAANPDMPVTLWVLGDRRAVPKGFFEIKIDEARVDWANRGSNYFGPNGLVSQAANEAGGDAFVAEYAGTSAIARGSVYVNGQYNLATLQAAMTPPAYVQQVISMGLSSDAQMLPLLSQYIPMPDAVRAMGVTESQFYGNLSLYWAQFAFPPYDLAGLTTAISTSIIKPRQDAQMMIDAHPYLTRLNTFISPEEMDKDPLFFVNEDLPDVANIHTATFRTMCGNMDFMQCNAPVRLELTDGRMAWVRAGSTSTTTCQNRGFDLAPLASLPALEFAWDRETTGEGTRVVDNTAMIQAGMVANNRAYAKEEAMFPTPTSAVTAGGPGGAGPGTGGTTDVGGSGGSGGGAPGIGGTGGTGVGAVGTGGSGGQHVADHGPAASGNGQGCACSVGNTGGPGTFGLLMAIGLALSTVVRRRTTRGTNSRG